MSEEASEDHGAIWVKTMPTLDGAGYMVTIDADDDTSRALTPDEAMTHAKGVLAAVARAEYDTAVVHQMTEKLDFDMTAAAEVIRLLRADRPPLDPEATAPIWLEPGVNAEMKPFLTLSVNGKRVGQWTMTDARSHAFFVLTSVAVADLDAAYLRLLVGTIGIDKPRALRVVDDLADYRNNSLA